MDEMHYIIMFDVFDGKRRRRLVKFLEDFAYRIQFSVFAMKCSSTQLKKLERLINLAIEPEEDSVFIFPITAVEWERKIMYGQSGLGMKFIDEELDIL